MLTLRRTLVAGLVLVAGLGLTACTSAAEPEPGGSPSGTSSGPVSASGTAPIVFAFVCRVGISDRTQTYTTYSAVWGDDRTDCAAERITGTEASAQQAAAVRASHGAATLEELASACAVRGVAPWTRPVATAHQAAVADGVLAYCPGHPEQDRLRDAVAAYRG
ncbi:hypothetical protein [Curtobacterium sp. ISL-83]|uniref:hypothetical protein n=1 Tax=Curtobacterium sp. ISL-83 TaxID=2819145 RepID=UPI001BE9A60A|nr:hypothetical protein [Curtobacterium sp. ISL-83]MBT2503914.1 hypothetical protein [Curtobacterium sp. ISL-83]